MNGENYPREIEIPVPWGIVSGKRWGPEDKQPILFLHGWQDNAASFDRLIPLLPNSIPILCIDFPGHGLSSSYPKGQNYYLFWDGLVLVRRIVKYFGWKKVSIVGHSLGGAVGFMYAGSYPDEVDKLVSLDIACPRVMSPLDLAKRTSESIDRLLKYETLTLDNQPCYDFEEMIKIALDGYKGSVTKEGIEVLMRRGMKPNPEKPDQYFFSRDVRLKVAALGIPSLDLNMEYARRITCDYMNIRASDGIKLDQPETYTMILDQIRATCRTFVYHQVEGTHHVHLNEPEKIVDYLADFLQN